MAFITSLPVARLPINPSCFRSQNRPKHTQCITSTATLPTHSNSSTSPGKSGQKPITDSPKATVSLVSLGCPKNVTDAEVMLGDLSAHGISILPPPSISDDDDDVDDDDSQLIEEADKDADVHGNQDQNADVVVINTCGFVEDAKRESIDAILSIARKKQTTNTKGIIVTGCLAQRYADTLAKELPEIDAVIGFEHYDQIPQQINSIINNNKNNTLEQNNSISTKVKVGKSSVPFRPEHERIRIGYEHSIYIRLAEGCSHSCTFCAIPGQFRGQFRSKKWDVLTNEISHLVKHNQKVKELVLIAEDTNQYGMDFSINEPNKRLSDLLHYISDNNFNNQVQWIRLLYCYPSYFTDSLIQAIANIDIVCKYIDIPLQHISDRILKRMNRPSRPYTVSLLNKLRKNIPGLVLRTTFIVGFPGETEEDHNELVDFIKEQKFQHAGFFVYSKEEGTPAADMDNQVPQEIKEYRRDHLTSIQQSIQEEHANNTIGQVVDVLIDKIENGHSIGRTIDSAPDIDSKVHILQKLEVGEMVKVRILGTSSFDLYGEPVA